MLQGARNVPRGTRAFLPPIQCVKSSISPCLVPPARFFAPPLKESSKKSQRKLKELPPTARASRPTARGPRPTARGRRATARGPRPEHPGSRATGHDPPGHGPRPHGPRPHGPGRVPGRGTARGPRIRYRGPRLAAQGPRPRNPARETGRTGHKAGGRGGRAGIPDGGRGGELDTAGRAGTKLAGTKVPAGTLISKKKGRHLAASITGRRRL